VHEDPPGLVVGGAGGAGQVARPGAGRRFQPQRLAVDDELQRALRDALAVLDRRGQHRRHARVALDRGGLQRLAGGRAHARDQLVDRRQEHVGLAEGRQDLLDVAQERRVRPHDQHAPPGQPVAVRVQQVGGPVQGDGGLAGARPALDDQDARQVRADDAVLLGLDGGDDVAHAAGPARAQGGEQRRLAVESLPLGVAERVEVQHVVVDVDDHARPGPQVAAAHDPAWRGRRRPVERLRRRGAPVDQQRLAVVVQQPDPSDVEAGAVGHVQPAEAQPVLGRRQLREPVGVPGHERVAVQACLQVAAAVRPQRPLQLPAGVRAQPVQPLVQHRHVGLFLLELGTSPGARSRVAFHLDKAPRLCHRGCGGFARPFCCA
jgi:hypothetical protein